MPKLISNRELIPVILSGGSGSRLWPLSRSSYPKQYLKLDKKNNFSLLQNTYLRLEGLENLSNPKIISLIRSIRENNLDDIQIDDLEKSLNLE